MKSIFPVLWIIVCLLAAFPGMADEARLQSLISQAQEAIARNDDAERSRIVGEIYELTTGRDAKFGKSTESLSGEEYEKRTCLYHKAIAPLRTREELERIGHEERFYAYFAIQQGEADAESLRNRLECVQDNGEPVPEAMALREGLAWAKRLHRSDIAETKAVAQEYEALGKRYPGNERYRWFHHMIDSLVDRKRAELEREKSNRRFEISAFRTTLAEKANKGDVAAQLEIARRLETGDRFSLSFHFAYYWYKRAQQNGGGEEAQKGLNRLLPQLTEVDLMLVKNWIEKKYVMY